MYENLFTTLLATFHDFFQLKLVLGPHLCKFNTSNPLLSNSKFRLFSLKKLIATLKNVAFVLDFHGHSKKYNSFIFACTG